MTGPNANDSPTEALRFRQATPDDAYELEVLFETAEAARLDHPHPYFDKNTGDRMLYDLQRDQVWSAVAVIGKKLGGFIIGGPAYPADHESPHHDEIRYLAVATGQWGRGIGGALLDRAINNSEANNRTTLEVWPYETNARAIELYKRKGFEPTGKIQEDPYAMETMLQHVLRLGEASGRSSQD